MADKEKATSLEVAYELLSERNRQRSARGEGFSNYHDDQHKDGSMAAAAACYAMERRAHWRDSGPPIWPWDQKWWKPKSRREDLIRAGALIIAEIERLDRLKEKVAP